MTKAYRIVLPLLGAWLAGWIYISWAAIQDDALIHLRYADNLFSHRLITYDGAHADYGASSLLYVAMLAFLRGVVTASPDLPRATSSIVHCFLFLGLAFTFSMRLPKAARVARLAALAVLIMVVTPSAVRWLDDGMETGIAVTVVSLLAWLIHRESGRGATISRGRYPIMAALSFLAVLLRTELVLLCGFGSLILVFGPDAPNEPMIPRWRRYVRASHLLLGASFAMCFIMATMHHLLPDTAVAKSHGLSHWFNPIHDTAVTLAGAFSFGAGMVAFWLLTLALAVLHRGRLTIGTGLANAFLPVELALASLRGQEIQGVRYFAWTLFFPCIWNILELAAMSELPAAARWRGSRSALLLSGFLVLLAIEMPFEARAMYRILTHRAETMRGFETQHLEVLHGHHGVASDIGYIGYFTGAEICDLSGLVNGRAAARLTSAERNAACAQTNPDFIFGNVSQLASLSGLADFSGWMVCGRYDFTNVRTLDSHYLAVRPAIANAVCGATGQNPEPLEGLLARK